MWGPIPNAALAPPCHTIQTINQLRAVKDTLLLKTTVAGNGLQQQLEAIDRQIQFYMARIVKVTKKTEAVSFFVIPEKGGWYNGKRQE